MNEIRILSATGLLGSGFREDTLKRAMTLGPDFIGADSGSTDPGPYYLGSSDTIFSDKAYKRDLRLMLLAARAAKIPMIVGSACTAGNDEQLARMLTIVREIAVLGGSTGEFVHPLVERRLRDKVAQLGGSN